MQDEARVKNGWVNRTRLVGGRFSQRNSLGGSCISALHKEEMQCKYGVYSEL